MKGSPHDLFKIVREDFSYFVGFHKWSSVYEPEKTRTTAKFPLQSPFKIAPKGKRHMKMTAFAFYSWLRPVAV